MLRGPAYLTGGTGTVNPDALLDLLRRFQEEGVEIRTLDIEGLLKTKTDYRDKDRIDREVLQRIRDRL